MTKTDFYNDLLGISDIKVTEVITRDRIIEIHCHIISESVECKQCESSLFSVNQYTERKVRDLDIVGKEVWLIITVRQSYCSKCNKYSTERLSFADDNKSYTYRQSKWIFEMCAQQPFTAVGAQLNMCHKTVENLYYFEAQKRINIKERYKNVTQLGIDEIAHRKGKGDFCCVITDLKTGRELDILPTRKKAAILLYFKELGIEICHKIKVVSCDIWDSYISVAKQCFPNAILTLDRFHVVKALNDGLDTYRKKMRQEFPKEDAFKNIKWTLFKQTKNCEQTDIELLNLAFEKSKELKRLHEIRNQFHRIYDTSESTQEMEQRLLQWASQASKLGLECLDSFVKMLVKRVKDIATFAQTHVTNAATEGLNNLIRYMKRLSFGLPNFEHMRLRVLVNTQ